MRKWIVALLFAPAAFADDGATAKYRNFTPQQIADIPQEVRQSSVPMMYIMAAQRGLSEGRELLFGMQLNSLMYAGLHDYGAAVKAFQKDLGDEPTGTFTVWQIHSLEYRAELQKLSRVGFPDAFVSYKDNNFASVEGTFVILDDRIAYPINHAKVRCFRTENECRVEQIELSIPTEGSWAQMYHVLESDPVFYTISQWTEDAVDAVPSGAVSRCRTTTLNLNFKAKEFYEIARNLGGDCKVLGTTLPKLEKPRISQIVDGEKIIGEEFARLQKAAFDLLASDFRTQAQRLMDKQPKK